MADAPDPRAVPPQPDPTAWAVVVAAGRGVRFGRRKQYARLAGRSVLEWSVAAATEACVGVVVVLPPEDVAAVGGDLHEVVVVPGGETRSASVRSGLDAVPSAVEVVAVHDAARPLAGADVWARVLAAVSAGADAAIPVVPVTDTIKQVDGTGSVRTLDRDSLVAVQTPQAFRADVLRRAHAGAGEATDDAALVEALGGRVVLVEGGVDNLKMTTTADLLVAEALARRGPVGAGRGEA